MTNDEFKYWISGYLSLSSELVMTTRHLTIVKNHINLVKAVDATLDEDIQCLLAMIEDNIKLKTTIPLSDLQEKWIII